MIKRSSFSIFFSRRRWTILVIALLLLSGMSLLVISPGSADVGIPPWPHQGGLVNPGDTPTNVQMVREDVLIRVEANEETDIFPYSDPAAHYMIGHADARFWMRNQGEGSETFRVWFPLWIPAGAYRPEEPLTRNLQVRVDDNPVAHEYLDVLQPEYNQTVPWGVWTMTFPPDEEVEIRVTYDVYPIGDQPYGTFEYILETGADWFGSIEEGTITIELPYSVADGASFVNHEEDSLTALPVDPSPDFYEVSGNQVIWRFEDFEPTESDNISLSILLPSIWEEIQRAQQIVEEDPQSAEAHYELAETLVEGLEIFKGQVLTNRAPNQVLAASAKQAYEEAFNLTPEDAIEVPALVGYLKLLFWMDLYERHSPPEEWLSKLEAAFQRNPDMVEHVISYFTVIYEDWGRRNFKEIEHPPIPSERSISLIESVNDIAPGELDWLMDWIDYAESQATMAAPTLPPIQPPDVTEEVVSTEPGNGPTGFPTCPGSLGGIMVVVLGIGTGWMYKRKSGCTEDEPRGNRERAS